MCILCLEFEKQKLSLSELKRNFQEMKESIPEEHQKDIIKIIKKEEDKNE